ncbi:MAG: hypothetical protein FJ206_16410 [Gemmatimonadetes bacterium]|nr:hypothetical protein [Gemmatimonadota bacterium]
MAKPSPGRASAESPFASLAMPASLAALLIAGDQVFQVMVSVQEAGEGPGFRFQLATSWVTRAVPLLICCFLLWAAEQAKPGIRQRLKILAGLVLVLAVSFLIAGLVMWFEGPAVRAGLQAEDLAPFVGVWVRGLVLAGLGVCVLGVVAFLLGKTKVLGGFLDPSGSSG